MVLLLFFNFKNIGLPL